MQPIPPPIISETKTNSVWSGPNPNNGKIEHPSLKNAYRFWPGTETRVTRPLCGGGSKRENYRPTQNEMFGNADDGHGVCYWQVAKIDDATSSWPPTARPKIGQTRCIPTSDVVNRKGQRTSAAAICHGRCANGSATSTVFVPKAWPAECNSTYCTSIWDSSPEKACDTFWPRYGGGACPSQPN